MAGRNNPEIFDVCKDLILSTEQCKNVVDLMNKEIKNGLGKETHPTSIVKCLVTHVHHLPTGRERGTFLALDLGGTNFRVLMIIIKSETDVHMDSTTFEIPEPLLNKEGAYLFDFIADCLLNFIDLHKLQGQNLPLGFTFSFPCRQVDLNNGVLIKWTKGFNSAGVVGKDVVGLLCEALRRKNCNSIEAVALLNDTTGTLMSCAWLERDCKIGLIVGTGSNACYLEKINKVEMFEGSTRDKTHVVINTEWGAFGDNGTLSFIQTQFDKEVDELSINQGKQIFEKMISGMYLGEIVRRIMVKLVDAKLLFNGLKTDNLATPWQFVTKYLSTVESDPEGSYANCRSVLGELGLNEVSDDDCATVRFICELVSTRSAHLVACGLVSLLHNINERKVTIAIDGSVYKYLPKYPERLNEKIKQLVNPSIEFSLMLSEDGSGRGAALVAATVADRKLTKSQCNCKRRPT